MTIQSGKHLGVVRRWMQRVAANGETCIWGSSEPLQMRQTLTPIKMEKLAQKISDVIVNEQRDELLRIWQTVHNVIEKIEKLQVIREEENDTLMENIKWDLNRITEGLMAMTNEGKS
jgi:hypothetical protein